MTIVLLVVVLELIVIGMAVWAFLHLRYMKFAKVDTASIQRDYPNALLIRNAKSLGLQVKEKKYMRGYGTLIITPHMLVFRMAKTSQDLKIPLKHLIKVEEATKVLYTPSAYSMTTVVTPFLRFYIAQKGILSIKCRNHERILFLLEDLRHQRAPDQSGIRDGQAIDANTEHL